MLFPQCRFDNHASGRATITIRVSRIALGVRGSVLLGGASSSALVFLEGSRSDPRALLLCSFSPSSKPEVSE